ncbi:2-methoxy-6-polyprenyl-1,4-benzoquinol methylase, mitochondrial-like [Saccostrea echinata]|uniref:2-methoxy-6-polyprenyl-1,4-benzoquinol methylase, mitochondrial-like n=1 Tax=Saccostrea echinata TaxID=191078 RepID=UPI002A7F35DA|nr:2-methoxy-6-polyprenyl-1,4-benzoquinol methylase, mitochondrial-like [Saccostrea echinata]
MAAPLTVLGICYSRREKPISSIVFRLLSTNSSLQKENRKNGETKKTHFGFQTVAEDEKEERVYKVFKNVASKYDLMNDSMSFGIHRLWKDHFINRMAPVAGTKLLDVAGGTGDIAFRFLKYIQSQNEKPVVTDENFTISTNLNAGAYSIPSDFAEENEETVDLSDYKEDTSHVTVCDINQEMLNVGKSRAEEAGIMSGISWVQGNAESLPFEDNTFDAYTIAYGIRNCTHIDKVLTEAYRVLKPGGRFMCLEFSQVNNIVLRRLYDSYSFEVIPVMGQVLAKDWKSYQYLVESIRQFPNQRRFAAMLQHAGFGIVSYENLTFGISAVHSGYKLIKS